MKVFTIFANKKIKDFVKDPIYVEEEFSLSAAIFGILWTIYHRMWGATIFIILLHWFLYLLLSNTHISHDLFLLVCLGVAIYIGSFAKEWYAQSLMKKGYQLKEVILARNLEEAQLQYMRMVNHTYTHEQHN